MKFPPNKGINSCGEATTRTLMNVAVYAGTIQTKLNTTLPTFMCSIDDDCKMNHHQTLEFSLYKYNSV